MLFSAGFENSLDETLISVNDIAASVSLKVLADVQHTADECAVIEHACKPVTKLVRAVAKVIRSLGREFSIDEDGAFVDLAQTQSARFANAAVEAVRFKNSLDSNEGMLDHHREYLRDCYDAMIFAISDLSAAILDLRAAVISHELAFERRAKGEIYSDIRSFVTALPGHA